MLVKFVLILVWTLLVCPEKCIYTHLVRLLWFCIVWLGWARCWLSLFGFWFERSVGLPREMHIYPLGEAVMAVWTCLQMPVQSIKLLMGTSQTRTSSANHHCTYKILDNTTPPCFCRWYLPISEVQHWFLSRDLDKIGSSLAFPQFYANLKIWFKLGSPQLTTHKIMYKINFWFSSPSSIEMLALSIWLVLVFQVNEIYRNELLHVWELSEVIRAEKIKNKWD